MLNNPAFRIFISSTTDDLKDARRSLVEEILKAGHVPVTMDSFTSSSRPSVQDIQDGLKNCDIFISISGERYGNTFQSPETDGREVSYTEYEFDYALKLNRPTLPFLLKEEIFHQRRSHLKSGDLEYEFGAQLKQFREKLKKGRDGQPRTVDFYYETAGLLSAVIQAVHKLINHPAFGSPGLVPADTVASPTAIHQLVKVPFLQQVLERLTEYQILFNRVHEQSALKEHMSNFFWYHCFRGIANARAYHLFFESGSTIAYVADGFLRRADTVAWKPDVQYFNITTNNILVFLQFLFHKTQAIPVALRPRGKPDTKYGATYGPIDGLHPIDSPYDEPLDHRVSSIVDQLSQHLASPPTFPVGPGESSGKLLILASTSGINSKDGILGPHVGSYHNKIFKRCLLKTGAPIVFFVDESKCLDETKAQLSNKCYTVCGTQLTWKEVVEKQSIAFCVCTTDSEKASAIAKILKGLGMTRSSSRASRSDYQNCIPFMMSNQLFADAFKDIPLEPIEKSVPSRKQKRS